MFSPPKFESESKLIHNQQNIQEMSQKKANLVQNSSQQYVNSFQGTTVQLQKQNNEVQNQFSSQKNQQQFNRANDNTNLIQNLILGYKNSKDYEQQTKEQQGNRSMNNLHQVQQVSQNVQYQQLQRSYQKEQVSAFNPTTGSNIKNDNNLNQSNDYVITNSAQKNQNTSGFYQNLQTNQHISAADFLVMNGNKISCGNANCNCSESSWALVRDYLKQLKQLSSEHLFASQENKRLLEQNQELLNENLNLKSQISIMEQKMVLYEKENMNKLNSNKEKIKSLEIFNKDLFNKITYYEQAILNYEQELKNVRQECYQKIQQVEDEKEYLKQNLETLHDTMNDAIASSEERYKSKIQSKNSKIKQLKHQANTDKYLIESYQTELVQLQTENKQLKDDLESLQQAYTQLQYENEDTLHKFQMQEIELQASYKLCEELRKKNEELQNHIALLINNQQFEGEDKLKAYQQINQQQISQLYNENQDLRKELQEWQEKAQVLKEGIEMETEKSSTLVKNLLIHMKTLIETKGKEDIEEQESPQFTQSYMKLDIFEEVRSQIIKLISSRHSLKKKKKSLQQKIDDLKEQIEDLQNTLHQVVNERQEEIIQNEQQQIQLQLLQQQQQLDQHLLQQNQLQNRQNLEEIQQQAHINSAQSTPISKFQRISVKIAVPQSSYHNQQLINTQNWIEDSTVQQSRGSQMISFQNPNLNNSQNKISNIDLQQIRRSVAQNVHNLSLNQDHQQNMINPQLINSQESDYARYQNQIDEILTLKDTHYTTIINDLQKQQTEAYNNSSCIVYILCKIIQNHQQRIARLNALLKQQTQIVFAFTDYYEISKQAEEKPKKLLSKLKSIFNQAIFISKLKLASVNSISKGRSSLKLLSLNLNNLNNGQGLKKYVISMIKDLEGDFGLYSSIKQIVEGTTQLENNLSLQIVKFQQNKFDQLINLIDEKQKDYQNKFPIFMNQTQTNQVKINSKQNEQPKHSQQSSKISESVEGSGRKNDIMNEKEIIETENIQLKNLIINLKEENEEIRNKIQEQTKNYAKVIENYEFQIQKLQNENEIHLEKNSKLIDMIDPKSRAILEQQPFLNDIQYDDFLDSQDQNINDIIPISTNPKLDENKEQTN
ncbi:hypothetical protein ABPG72_019587 [Tetrahymena utriculariae]